MKAWNQLKYQDYKTSELKTIISKKLKNSSKIIVKMKFKISLKWGRFLKKRKKNGAIIINKSKSFIIKLSATGTSKKQKVVVFGYSINQEIITKSLLHIYIIYKSLEFDALNE